MGMMLAWWGIQKKKKNLPNYHTNITATTTSLFSSKGKQGVENSEFFPPLLKHIIKTWNAQSKKWKEIRLTHCPASAVTGRSCPLPSWKEEGHVVLTHHLFARRAGLPRCVFGPPEIGQLPLFFSPSSHPVFQCKRCWLSPCWGRVEIFSFPSNWLNGGDVFLLPYTAGSELWLS